MDSNVMYRDMGFDVHEHVLHVLVLIVHKVRINTIYSFVGNYLCLHNVHVQLIGLS